jgi:rRNA maturation protein Nop10
MKFSIRWCNNCDADTLHDEVSAKDSIASEISMKTSPLRL